MMLALTALGVSSAAGAGADALCAAIESGRSCLGPLGPELSAGLPVSFGGRAPVDLVGDGDRAGALADAALAELFDGAGLDPETRSRTGLTLGTGLGAMERSEAFLEAGETLATARLHPHSLTSELAERHGLGGPIGTHTVTCVSALYALEQACCELTLGRAPAMVCGGVETLSRTILGGFCALEALSKSAGPSRPSANDGIVLGEGACFVLLEDVASAAQRGHTPRAIVRGRGLHTDGTHMTSPDVSGVGMESAAAHALAEAGASPDQVGRITLTAPASPAYGLLYSNALGRVFGEGWEERALTWEESVGHVLGASGALGLAFGTLLLEGRCRSEPQLTADTPYVLSLSVGFGGQSGATVLGLP
jgi:3-oxoacyl-[acyl-carrier-protein] synthase II